MSLQFYALKADNGWYIPTPSVVTDGSWSPTSKDLEVSWARIMERLDGQSG